MTLEELRKLYNDKINEAKGMLEKAETEKRALTKEENTEYEKKVDEALNVKSQIRAMEKAQELEEDKVRAIVKDKEFAEPKQEKFRGMGEFLDTVRRSTVSHQVDTRLTEERATGLNESIPSEGGFLVPQEFSTELLKNSYQTSLVASRANRSPIKGNSISYKRIKETTRANGSRYGGIQLYWINEAGTITASKPTFGELNLKLQKIVGMYYASEEVLSDAVALESDIDDMFTEEFGFKIDDAVINGTGAGVPLGILNAPCKVEVSKEAGQLADTLLYENIVKMWARMWAPSRANAVWFINQDVEPQLMTMSLAVGVGGAPVYMQPGGASVTPYATLMGRPVVPIEQCKTLGTSGDIILADFNKYKMIEKGNIVKASSMHVSFATDETAFRFIYRCDGQPMWDSALTPANGSNTLSPFVVLEDR
jgi:HK97 family phage major capsid protein